MSDEKQQKTAPAISYDDEDLVYVDPRRKIVVGKVEWTNTGKPKSKFMEELEEDPEGEHDEKKPKRAPRKKRAYPWGTYRTMKKIYKIEGKQHNNDEMKTFDDALKIAIDDAF